MGKGCLGYLLLVLGLLAGQVGCAASLEDRLGVEAVNFPEGTSVVFDGPAGRFVSFEVDGEEYFWANPEPEADGRTGWVDYGGDKVWVLAQDQWKKYLGRVWPPGRDLEGLPWKGEADDWNMETEIAPAGVRVLRDWGLVRDEKGFGVTTFLWRTSESIHAPVHIWGIGQVKAGEFGLIGFGEGGLKEAKWFGQGRQGCRVVMDGERAVALVARPGAAGGKVGTMGRWVAAVYRRHVLVRVLREKPGYVGEYADRSSVQLFQTREYWELETLGPVRELKIGERMHLSEEWMVWERPAGLGEAELARWVDGRVRGR